MRLMYDGINTLAAGIAATIPDAAMIAYYVDGNYAWNAAEIALFPHAVHVPIAVHATTNNGVVLDVENGDATPGQSPDWIRMRKAAGVLRPTIYCSRDVIPAVRAATGTYILGRDYDIWAADYTGAAHQVVSLLPPAAQCAAVQYESTPHYDISAVYDDAWPHVAPPPPPGPTKAEAQAALAVLAKYVG